MLCLSRDDADILYRKIKRMIFETLHKFNGKQEVMMSISQIKQIAGRAGRYGQHDADAGAGSVTTMNPSDLPLLKDVLKAPLTPVHRAVLDANSAIIPRLSLLLPPEATHAQLLDEVAALALVPSYCVPSDTSGSAKIADAIEQYHDSLTLSEIMMFVFAPVNTRDERVVAAFRGYIERFVDEGCVLIDAALPPQLLENLEMVELARKTIPDADHLESRQPTNCVPTSIPPAIVAGLPMLESMHKAIVLYLWLSFRMDLAFPDRQKAGELKLRVEDALEFCLERLPGLKQKRAKFKGHSRAEREEESQLVKGTQNEKIDYLTADQVREAKRRIKSRSTDVLHDL
jgi:ATP-dependent RNA helicase SUPV3L1/SUV3